MEHRTHIKKLECQYRELNGALKEFEIEREHKKKNEVQILDKLNAEMQAVLEVNIAIN